MQRRTLTLVGSAVVLLVVLAAVLTGCNSASSTAAGKASSAAASGRRTALLSCMNRVEVRPTSYVISCADANAELVATHWANWSKDQATGTTRFGLNLCDPYCAASRISYFPRSSVRLSGPVKTAKHGWLFSKITVHYLLDGKVRTFAVPLTS